MKVINLYAGPGTGKSITAAEVFVQLKKAHLNAEIVTEYVKDKVWEESFAMMENQIYLFGKQQHRLWRVSKKCDVVVTDSPLLLSLFYGQKNSDAFKQLVKEEYGKYENINIYLKRVYPYNPIGRTQTEAEAKEADKEILKIVKQNCRGYAEFESNDKGTEALMTYLTSRGIFLPPSVEPE